MKTTVVIPNELFNEAMLITKAHTKKEVILTALRKLVTS